MLTRYFSTSKPIHLVIISLALVVLFVATKRDGLFNFSESFKVLSEWLILAALLFSFLVFAFFTSKNNLTASTSYKLLFYLLFLMLLPQCIKNNNVLIANMFVLLAMRRIISLRTQKNIYKKVLDAALWICIASLFYFWSFLFFALIFGAMLLHDNMNLKIVLIPFIGLAAITIIVVAINILDNNIVGSVYDYIMPIDFDFSTLNDISIVISLTWIVSLFIWASFFYLNNIKDQPKVFRSSHFLILLAAFIATLIAIVAPTKTSAEFLFLVAPFAIIVGNYIQSIQEKWFSEVIIWLSLVLPFLVVII